MRMLLGGAASIIAACGGSDGPSSDAYFSCGLRDQVALVELGADHAVLLTPRDGQRVERSTVPVGKGALIAKSSQNGTRLFVVSRGEEGVEAPSLTVVDVTNAQAISSRRYELPALHSGMEIDPDGRWVALHTVLTRDYTGIDVESQVAPEITGVEGETRNERGMVPELCSTSSALEADASWWRLPAKWGTTGVSGSISVAAPSPCSTEIRPTRRHRRPTATC